MQTRRSFCLGLTGFVTTSTVAGVPGTAFAARMKNLKCVVIGADRVGKTSLLITYTTGKFPNKITQTVFDNYSANVKVGGNWINLGLWDTAGNSDYDRLRPLSYPKTEVFVVCYSVEQPASFSLAREKFIPEARHHVPKAPLILVACKTDLRSKGQGRISTAQGQALAKQVGARSFVECSSLAGTNVKGVFDSAIRAIL